jgi:hypothetical protein
MGKEKKIRKIGFSILEIKNYLKATPIEQLNYMIAHINFMEKNKE